LKQILRQELGGAFLDFGYPIHLERKGRGTGAKEKHQKHHTSIKIEHQ